MFCCSIVLRCPLSVEQYSYARYLWTLGRSLWKLSIWSVCMGLLYTDVSRVPLVILLTGASRKVSFLSFAISVINWILSINVRAFSISERLIMTEVSYPSTCLYLGQCSVFKRLHHDFRKQSGYRWFHRHSFNLFIDVPVKFKVCIQSIDASNGLSGWCFCRSSCIFFLSIKLIELKSSVTSNEGTTSSSPTLISLIVSKNCWA